MRASIIRGCYRSESLLSSCVPNLQLHILSIDLNRADLEVDSDGRKILLLLELVIRKAQNERTGKRTGGRLVASTNISNSIHVIANYPTSKTENTLGESIIQRIICSSWIIVELNS